jgi:DNA modification methylase
MAMKAVPELALAKTERDALKILNKIEEKILIAELTKRQQEQKSPSSFAAAHFIIEDAFIGMPKIKSASIDFANVDTPYGIDLTRQKKSQTGIRTDDDYTEWSADNYLKIATCDDKPFYSGYAWDTMREMFRVLKPDAFMVWWFGIQWYAPLFAALSCAGFTVDKIPCVWNGGAGGAQCNQPETTLARSYDTFFMCRKGNPVLVKRGRANIFSFDKAAPQNKIHPTEKPLELMKEIFSLFLLPGMNCISPFLGSGNDLRAMYSMKTSGVGFELDENLKNRFLLRVEDDIKSKIC